MFNFKSKLSAKKRFDKVEITEQAIDKVPYIKYKGVDKKTCEIIQHLAKLVLRISKEKNDNDEVAITFEMPIEIITTEGKDIDDILKELTYGVAYGDGNSVVLESDTLTNHILIYSFLQLLLLSLCYTTIQPHKHYRLTIWQYFFLTQA